MSHAIAPVSSSLLDILSDTGARSCLSSLDTSVANLLDSHLFGAAMLQPAAILMMVVGAAFAIAYRNMYHGRRAV